MKSLDAVDMSIIQTLGKDAMLSSENVANQLGVSAATVRRRIRKLVKNGTLRVIGAVEPSKAGLPVAALIALDLPHDEVDRAADHMAAYPEVKWLANTTGPFNLRVFVRTSCTDELAAFIQSKLPKLEGLRNSEITVCLNVKKGQYVPI